MAGYLGRFSTLVGRHRQAREQGWPGGNGVNGGINAFAVFDDGTGPALFAGGPFSAAGDVNGVNGIAKWNGASWAPVGGGLDGTVLALTVFDDGTGPALYVGGVFGTVGDIPASRIARWDGLSWTTLGNGIFDGPGYGVDALAVYDGGMGVALFVGGYFDRTVDGLPSKNIAKWGPQ